MPWKEQRGMSLRLQFVERAAVKGSNVTELYKEFGISRQTGHKWLRRYRELGPLGLVEESRRPDSTPSGTGEDVVWRFSSSGISIRAGPRQDLARAD
jgi:putative transposase